MEKKASDFIVDSKGYCFLCLSKISTQFNPIAKLDEKFNNSHSSAYSLQDVSRYLKIDMRKVFIDQGPVPPHLLAKVERARLKVELCEGCGSMTENVSKLCRQLEKLNLEIKSGLESIHAKITEVDQDGRTEQFRRVADSKLDSGMGGCMEILEVLRMETMQKCSHKINKSSPRLKIQKLTNGEIERKTRRIPTRVTETSSEDNFMGIVQPDSANWALEEGNHNENSFENDLQNDVEVQDNDDSTTTILKVDGEPVQQRVTADTKAMRESETAPGNNPQRKWIMNSTTGKYKCIICSKEYGSIPNVFRHYASAHRRVRFKCKICGKEFSQQSNYKTHHKSVHLGVRFQCKVCKNMFTQKSSLMVHQRNSRCEIGIKQKVN